MNIPNWLKYCATSLLKFLHLQLFLTLVSLPILSAWGLPISLMTFVGNLVFAPLLTSYLILSALVFMTQLFTVPNAGLIYSLEHLTTFWEWVTGLGYPQWLIGIPEQPLVISLMGLVVVFAVMHNKRSKSFLWSTTALLLLFILIIALCKYMGAVLTNSFCIPHGSNIVEICTRKNGFVDLKLPKRFMLQTRSIDSWIDYTLIPEITKKVGSWHGCTIIAHKKTGSIDKLIDALHGRCYMTDLVLQEAN